MILGLDIGGANLKAATADKRAVSVPFALWKQPDKLPHALAELVAKFPDADELAVTMTGELCDCFETKRDGVNAILNAVLNVSRSRPIRVWSTDGEFLNTEESRRNHLKVAASNWHALATLAGQYMPEGRVILLDVGSTTTDIIPILDGQPVPKGKTDYDRIATRELLYAGVKRTPVCAILGLDGATELFATTHDVYLTLGLVPETPDDTDTADGRPATRAYARARLCRMLGGDIETVSEERTRTLAEGIFEQQCQRMSEYLGTVASRLREMRSSFRDVQLACRYDYDVYSGINGYIVSGAGEFLARRVIGVKDVSDGFTLSDRLGPEVSACAPAYAVAVLATERR